MSDTHTTRPDLAGKAKEMARDFASTASDATDAAKRMAKENASRLGEAAADLADTAKEKVGEQVSRQKSAGADYIESIARATERAAGEFEADIPQAAHYIRQASAQLQSVADTVRDRDTRELIGDVQEFARQQPTLFFGGAVVLGFAALRFLKSSSPKKSRGTGRETYEG